MTLNFGKHLCRSKLVTKTKGILQIAMSLFVHDSSVLAELKKISSKLNLTNQLLQSIDATLKTPDVELVEPNHLVIKYGPITKQNPTQESGN